MWSARLSGVSNLVRPSVTSSAAWAIAPPTASHTRPGGFFAHNAECGDARRICGFSALYTQLRILRQARGTLLRYDQTTFPGSQDTVSHCSMVFEGA